MERLNGIMGPVLVDENEMRKVEGGFVITFPVALGLWLGALYFGYQVGADLVKEPDKD